MDAALLIRGVGAVVCIVVLVACVCRIDAMRVTRGGALWFAAYVLFAVYALGVLVDLALDLPVSWYEVAGVAGAVEHAADPGSYKC